MNGGIPERKQVGENFHVRVVEPASGFCARDGKCRKMDSGITESDCLRNDYIVKYSVDPALTDIRGEFPRKAEANLGVVTPAVGPLRGD